MLAPGSRIHVLGACGTAMATFAAMLKDRGHLVRGSDQDVYPPMSELLAEKGIELRAPYGESNLDDPQPDLVVVGNAIPRGNAEMEAVLDRGIRGLATYLRGRMAHADSPMDAIREWIRGIAAQAGDPDGAQATRPFVLARGKLAESFPAEVARSATQIKAPLRAALERAVDMGEAPEADPERDSEALYLLMMGFVEARLLEGRIPQRDEVAHLETFILSGLSRGTDLEDLP